MERFIPVECFRKKGNTFRGITFFSLLPEFPEISVPFVHNYQCQASHGNFSEMTAMPKMAGSSDESLFQTIYTCDSCFFSSPLLTNFLQHHCSTPGEKDLSFGHQYLCFSFAFMIVVLSLLARENTVDADR